MDSQKYFRNIWTLSVFVFIFTNITYPVIANPDKQKGQILEKENNMLFEIKSTDFSHGDEIPLKFTCEGENISPELQWSGAPANTKSFVLIVDDPDAPDPDAPKTTFVHWVVYDIPPGSAGFKENIAVGKTISSGGIQGITDYRILGYKGPCPPIGRHRYFFKLYALDTVLKLDPGKSKTEIIKAIHGHVKGEAVLMGTYKKTKK
jgi:hypothetical protein